jgi:hypothetical protein
LFAALLLADEFAEQSAGFPTIPADAEIVAALEKLADRVEGIADALESRADNA